ncbi:error-prone DNA polymerase [Devosia limi]|uniref:Error-prone DNA polymerase n=1 Tax=Devosia limi DSM 17137 TaxID=1121477 RepID=A0A1M4ZFM4_9HYPH|nr:error-prone DNA polymerase [Devosia limi]SHF16830.1 error-prone DNA polymerase [Devosia limi DSM 17137]
MSRVVALPERPARPAAGLPTAPAYAELVTTSNFSFLRAGSHPEELVAAALALGLNGLGLCDRNTFAGVVRGFAALRDLKPADSNFRYVVGTRLCFADGTPDITAYPSDRQAYGRLCQLLSAGNMAGAKGYCHLTFDDLRAATEGQLFIVHFDEAAPHQSRLTLQRLVQLAPDRVWLAAACRFQGHDRARLARLAALAEQFRIPLIAVNDVLYHEPGRRILQDVVTCIREHLTIAEAGRRLEAHAERHLKPPMEMARLFAAYPDAIAQTQTLLSRIAFSLEQLRYNYPEETVGNGETAQQTLERLTWIGAQKRYPAGVPDAIKASLWKELCLIGYKGYAAYFLTVHDIVQYARHERQILCQGRGSAANSAVCFCLEITEVDPATANLVFGRFISTERDEPPDIDVDFEHERREEVMQYIYGKYGGNHTGLTANVISYRTKSAIRETCKVFGISDDTIAALNQLHWGWSSDVQTQSMRDAGLDPADPTLAMAMEVARALRGFPRHLSQHVGGFVITRDPLNQLVPIGQTAMDSRTIVEWNKDDIDTLGILKVDILALGMLSCLRRAFEMMHVHYGLDLKLVDLLAEEKDPDQSKKARVYAMTHRADTIGVFQIESRAQMSMLPRLKPTKFYDLVIEVAIVRPGPIQGGMVHPYLQRRLGNQEVNYPSPELQAVLERTLGIPLFQEQAMQIAIVGAGFSAGKADQLRRAMAAWRRTGKIAQFGDEFISGMLANGYPLEFAKASFAQIQGFAEYGFPESHAASFALLVYASCWLKCHYPDVFATALLNSQPMGFYAPSQIIRDAQEHGVEIRPVDVNLSDLESVLEEGSRPANQCLWPQHADMIDDIRSTKAIRLGLSFAEGLREGDANIIIARRGAGYDSVRDLWLRTGLGPAILERLANADAFASLGLSRRDALWAIKGLMGTEGAQTLPLFASADGPRGTPEADAELPPMPPGESVIHDYRHLSYSLKGHPVQFLRPLLEQRRIVRAAELINAEPGRFIEVAGLVLVRQRPGTASGVIFATLEDETGIANIVIWPKVFEANRRIVLGSRLLAVRGQLQREGLVIHIIARELTDMTRHLLDLAAGQDMGDAILARGDEGRTGSPPGRDRPALLQIEAARRQAYAALPGGRNFH